MANKTGIGLYGRGATTFGRDDFKLPHHHVLRVLQHVAVEHVGARVTLEWHEKRARVVRVNALDVLPPPAVGRRGPAILRNQGLKLDQMQMHIVRQVRAILELPDLNRAQPGIRVNACGIVGEAVDRPVPVGEVQHELAR
jgi:hypothetical protein